MASSRVGTRTRPDGRARPHARGQALEERQGERGRLARAGGRLADQVAALEQGRNGLYLDGRRLFVAQGGQHVEETGRQAQASETGVHRRRDQVNHR